MSDSSGSSTAYTLPPGVSINVPVSVSPDITDEDIAEMFPGIEFLDEPGPNDNPPPPPDNTWALVGKIVTGYIIRWVYKKFGWLLVLEAVEPAGPED